jgi:hypothetical protein
VARSTVFDGELVAISVQDGRVMQDFATVCRATLQGEAAATPWPPTMILPKVRRSYGSFVFAATAPL